MLEQTLQQIRSQSSYACMECKETFTTKADLKHHLTEFNHKLRKYKFSCKHCVYSSNSTVQLDQHVQSVHKKLRLFSCKQCGDKFGWEVSLNRHVLLVHEKPDSFTCRYCLTLFSTNHRLNKHLLEEHDESTTHKCAQCEKDFILKEKS